MPLGELLDLVDRLGEPHVLVVGDLMLDRYVWGDADRMSQESPVAVLRADRLEHRLGGAGSVCANLIALGARVACAGVVGRDADGRVLQDELRRIGVDPLGVVELADRPTTMKQRFLGRAQHRHSQQMLRVDFEQTAGISPDTCRRILDRLVDRLDAFDIVLVSDYDKGVCTPEVLRSLILAAREADRRVVVDPIRGSHYAQYQGAHCITPNRLEAQLASGMTIGEASDAVEIGRHFCAELGLEAAIVTLDRDGMCLCLADGSAEVFPTRARQVYDITGAGDMVLSAIGLVLAAGRTYADAVRLGNVAGGLEVEKIGVATVTRDEIRRDLLAGHRVTLGKIRSCDDLLPELGQRRQRGETIAFTNGVFDLLHVGHVRYLQAARAEADALVVGLNSDRSTRQIKGPERPINGQDQRSEMLAALDAVDYVVVFDEPTPQALIEQVRPDVLIKGADWADKGVVGREFVEGHGGRVVLAEIVPGMSTTELVRRIRAPHSDGGTDEG